MYIRIYKCIQVVSIDMQLITTYRLYEFACMMHMFIYTIYISRQSRCM